jgi:hypothetical protein
VRRTLPFACLPVEDLRIVALTARTGSQLMILRDC